MVNATMAPNAQEPTHSRRVSRWGLIFAHAVILFVLTGHIFSAYFEIELWPFSPYPMYSTVRTEYRVEDPVLYAVVDDAAGTEIPLRQIAYFAEDRARGQLLDTYEHIADAPQVQQALADLLARYEAERRGHGEAGPPVRAVRLYQMSWQLVAGADEVETPQHRTLLIEVAKER